LLRFDPEWLNETSRKTDFASGLEGWSRFGTKGVEIISHPSRPGSRVLAMRKPEADWPAAAVWNFPNGTKGRVVIHLKLNAGFGGARIGLTDHFSVPFDPEDIRYNLFNLNLEPHGTLVDGAPSPTQWHTLELASNCARHECRVIIDGRSVETLPLQRQTTGVNYLRLTSTAADTDRAGFVIESVEASVSE
jgi:hypothetical protein